ncbi:MAG: restriction endonuclease subunit S [Treponema sp.]|nr:restriction endonuclease subunit S [Treponema sp.]
MEEWKECKLGEIATITKLAGFEFTKYIKYNETGEIIALRALNLRNGRLDLTEVKHIDKSVSDALPRSKLYKGEILFTYTGNGYGDCALVDEDDKYHLAPNICKISPNKKIADSNFLFQTIRSNAFYKQVSNYIGGSSQPTIPMETIRQLKVKLPPLPTQQKIAAILSSLDDKIELNNKINTNLEQQAQALFKNWFVDFEPFGGKIPEGWKEKTLDTFCNIFTGRKNANASVTDGKYKFFTCSPNVLPIDSFIFDGDAIIISGNGAYTGRTRFYSGKFDLYQRTYACTIKEDQNPDYIFVLYWIIRFVLSKKIMGGTHGSAIPYIVMDDIAKFIINYDKKVFDDLSKIMKSYVLQIQDNENQNEKLAELRDSLLPKLMNGEISI